jgi:hypothetical protein
VVGREWRVQVQRSVVRPDSLTRSAADGLGGPDAGWPDVFDVGLPNPAQQRTRLKRRAAERQGR